MFDKLRKIVKTGYESVKKGCEVVKDKALALFVGAGATAGATLSEAAVTVGTDGTLSGTLDMAGYNSALTIVIAATIAIVIGGIILSTIKKV